MRLLVIVPEYPPFVKGGPALHAGELYEMMVQRGHVVTVVAPVPKGEKMPNTQVGPQICWFENTLSEPSNFEASVLQLNCLTLGTCLALSAKAYDLVVLHHFTQGLAAIEVSRRWGIPLVWHAHALYSATLENTPYDKELQYFREYELAIAKESRRIIAVSPYLAKLIIGLLGVEEERVRIIPKSIHPERFARPCPQETGKQGKEPVIGFVGRISWEKGLETLLESVACLVNEGFPVQLHIAGVADDASYLSKVREMVTKLGIKNRVVFRGFLRDNVLVRFYHGVDVIAIPSLYESFGRVAIEAMAAGTPVVARAVGGLADVIIDGKNGILVEGDSYAFAQALKRLLTDVELSRRIVEHAIETVKTHYAWHSTMEQTIGTYEGCLHEGGKNVPNTCSERPS